MCRLLAYMGSPLIIDTLLYQPNNSLIHQSYHALERRDPVNGDGFGVAWYMPELTPEPTRFVSIQPAWNNLNLRSLSPRVKSGCILAHVRAAGVGAVSELNCHPFQYKEFVMMHNGDIGGFKKIKRKLCERLSDEMFNWIAGQTDSEHFFALFLTHLLRQRSTNHSESDIVGALRSAITELKSILVSAEHAEHFYLNLVVTNGKVMVATRYDTNRERESPSLYHSEGSAYICEGGICRMVENQEAGRSVLIVSEKLTSVEKDWKWVPEEHFVVVNAENHVSVVPAEI